MHTPPPQRPAPVEEGEGALFEQVSRVPANMRCGGCGSKASEILSCFEGLHAHTGVGVHRRVLLMVSSRNPLSNNATTPPKQNNKIQQC